MELTKEQIAEIHRKVKAELDKDGVLQNIADNARAIWCMNSPEPIAGYEFDDIDCEYENYIGEAVGMVAKRLIETTPEDEDEFNVTTEEEAMNMIGEHNYIWAIWEEIAGFVGYEIEELIEEMEARLEERMKEITQTLYSEGLDAGYREIDSEYGEVDFDLIRENDDEDEYEVITLIEDGLIRVWADGHEEYFMNGNQYDTFDALLTEIKKISNTLINA